MKSNWLRGVAVLLGLGLLGGASSWAAGKESGDEVVAVASEDSAADAKEEGEEADDAKEAGEDAAEMKEGEGESDEASEAMEEEAEDAEMAALDKQDAELENESIELVERYHDSDEKGAKESLRAQIVTVVGKHFAVRQERRELQIKRMEEELQKLREEVAKRSEGREKIVNKRVADLIGDDSELDF